MPLACDENALLRYGLGLMEEEEAAEVRRHIAACPSCAAYFTTIGTSPDQEASATQREHSRSAVDELLKLPQFEWQDFLASHGARFANHAAVQALIQECESALDRDLSRSRALSLMLITSADALPPSFASRTLQALAWTRRATALLRVGLLQEALTAVHTAEARAELVPAADYERALIAFTAADILRELGDTAEALRQIRKAGTVFDSYADARRRGSAREMEAAVLFRCGEYDSAVAIFLELLGSPRAEDPVVRGRLSANAAHCFAAIGNYHSALPLFIDAEHVFTTLGHHSYVARIAWGKARVVRSIGDDTAALEALRNVFDRFDELGATTEWVRVGIELVEWLLPTDASIDTQSLCTRIYERAIHAGMKLQALEAVSYLREAALRETLDASSAQYVRHFIERLATSPEAIFEPPPA